MNIYQSSSDAQIILTYLSLGFFGVLFILDQMSRDKKKEFINITKIMNEHRK